MHLEWLRLADVRCYHDLDLRPDPGVNVFVGGNGAGKTTILEAVAYLGSMRSFRGTPDEALIRSGAAEAIVRGAFDDGVRERLVEVAVPRHGRRRVLLNGKRPARMRDLLSEVPVVAFQPDDLDLVKRGPVRRRDYLDDLAAALWPSAAADQTDAERALRQRNALLRQEGRAADPATLDVWDERYAASGARLYAARVAVLDAIEDTLERTYREIGRQGALRWRYTPGWFTGTGDAAAALLEALRERRQRDMETRTTSVGPHRDDPVLMLDDRPVRTAASQGEQRTAALALRLAAFRAIADLRDVVPILLLDDVFSELDTDRVAGVVAELPEGQVLVTTAREDEVPVEGVRWNVSAGKVHR